MSGHDELPLGICTSGATGAFPHPRTAECRNWRSISDELPLIHQAEAIAAHPLLPIDKVGPWANTRELVGALGVRLAAAEELLRRIAEEDYRGPEPEARRLAREFLQR